MLVPADLKRLSAMLDEALDLPEHEREAWLARLSETDALAPTLRELLARQGRQETGDLIDRLPAFTVAAEPPQASALAAGDTVGPYRLLRELGRGGMGEVWLAERTDGQLKRPVALKLPMLSARRSVLVQRFARERDILGALAHPHIARLYDAGLADDGQPYLALEYVEGQPITAYCDAHRLDARARIALLRQVMAAVQYAHANLVIHRDLKPSNVLVTAEGQAMLLDFGIAKLLQDEHSEAAATELTQLGGRALTLGYAAPEQISGAPVSIATDVYALGVLLYELLAAQRPFVRDTRAALENDVLTAVPVRPSHRKGGAIDALPRSLRADLDTITLKALKKLPAERYATVNALLDDLERFERGEPVLAQPDSRWYRTRKFVARHRVPVVASCLAATALIVASAVALLQADAARQEAKRAQTVQTFLADLFQANSTDQPDPVAAQRMTARELLDRGAARVDDALRDQPRSRFEVMGTLAQMYWQLGLESQAAAIEARRLDLARTLYGRGDVRLAEVLLGYTSTISESDKRDQIPALVDEATAALDRAGARSSDLRGQALVIASEYWSHESLPRSMELARRAVAFLERHHPASDLLVQAHLRLARGHLYLGEFDQAIAQAQSGLQAAQRLGPGAAAFSLLPAAVIADAYAAQLRLDRAEEQLRRELALAVEVNGEDNIRALTTKARLGNLLHETGRIAEADALHEAVRRATARPGPGMEEFQRQFVLGILGLRLLERGRPDLQAPILKADLDELRRTIPRSGVVIQRLQMWAVLQAAIGHIPEARASLESAQSLWAGFVQHAVVPVASAAFAIGRARIHLAAGDPSAALEELARVPPSGPRNELAHAVESARALLALGRPAQAAEAAASALHRIAALPEGYRPVWVEADARLLHGQALLAAGDLPQADADLRTAVDMRHRNDAPDSLWLAQARIAWATCLLRMGQRDLARRMASDAQRAHGVLGDGAASQAGALKQLMADLSAGARQTAGR